MDVAGHPQSPPRIPEVAPQSPGDRGRGEGEERRPPAGVEAPEGKHERLVGHLDQVVHRFAVLVLAAGGGGGEAAVAVYEAVEHPRLAASGVGDVEGPVVGIDGGAGRPRHHPAPRQGRARQRDGGAGAITCGLQPLECGAAGGEAPPSACAPCSHGAFLPRTQRSTPPIASIVRDCGPPQGGTSASRGSRRETTIRSVPTMTSPRPAGMEGEGTGEFEGAAADLEALAGVHDECVATLEEIEGIVDALLDDPRSARRRRRLRPPHPSAEPGDGRGTRCRPFGPGGPARSADAARVAGSPVRVRRGPPRGPGGRSLWRAVRARSPCEGPRLRIARRCTSCGSNLPSRRRRPEGVTRDPSVVPR